MTLRTVAVILFAAALAGCSGASWAPPVCASVAPQAALGPPAALQPDRKKHHYVYWTLFASCSYPQIQFARVPMGDVKSRYELRLQHAKRTWVHERPEALIRRDASG